MATRFAIGSGVWSSGGTWDNGSVPVTGDDVYSNTFTVTLNQDISVSTLRNSTVPFILPNMLIPKMLGNNNPTGNVFASSSISTAYQAFDQNSSTSWTATNTSGFIGYQFQTAVIIRQYYIVNTGAGYSIRNWTFEASNDGVNYTTLHSFTGNSGTNTTYFSGVFANSTGFTYYRLNVSSTNGSQVVIIFSLEMTDSTGTIYGGGAGGGYVVPATLSGTTTINSKGDGLISNGTTTVLTINSPSGATVNFTKDSGTGIYIVGPNWRTGDVSHSAILINTNTTVNYIGDLGAHAIGRNVLGAVRVAGAANFNLYGNIYSSINNNTYCITLLCNGNGATVNIIGSIYGSTAPYTWNNAITNTSNSTINIIGNVIGNYGYAFRNFDSATFGGGPLNVQGVVQTNSTSAAAAIFSETTALVTLSGPLINTNNTMAVYASRLRFYSGTTTQWRFQDTANATRVLYQSGYTGTTIGLPASIDVRKNTVYGQYNEFTGTLVVPSPSDVRINVLTDNTVGTGQLTAEDFLNAITASTLPIAVRLQNISTTQTMGTQLAALSGRT